MAAKAPRITLKAGRDLSVRKGHPWIFSGGVEATDNAQPGDFIDFYTSNGEYLGCGHFGADSISVKILSTGSSRQSEEAVLSANLARAIKIRRDLGLFSSPATDAFRLVHGEGDLLGGLVCDLYGSVAVIDPQTPGMERAAPLIEDLIKKLLPDRIKAVIIRSEDTGESHEHEFEKIKIRENDLTFLVDVVSGQKTGFFLDQRENRSLLERYSDGKRVLNAFSYTGGFSVYAARGSAMSITSIDTSEKALDRLSEHMEINAPDIPHKVLKGDCLPYLKAIPEEFDLIVLDPPAFIKHKGAYKGGITGYRSINANAIRQIAQGGILFTFSCSQLLSFHDFKETVISSAREARRDVRILHTLHQAPCHPVHAFCPESEYLKGLVLYVD